MVGCAARDAQSSRCAAAPLRLTGRRARRRSWPSNSWRTRHFTGVALAGRSVPRRARQDVRPEGLDGGWPITTSLRITAMRPSSALRAGIRGATGPSARRHGGHVQRGARPLPPVLDRPLPLPLPGVAGHRRQPREARRLAAPESSAMAVGALTPLIEVSTDLPGELGVLGRQALHGAASCARCPA